MAEAPTDLSTRDNLEQKILQVLSDAGVPVKTAQLVKECQVPKKLLNQVLYRLKKEARVSSEAPATWCLGGDAPGDAVTPVPEVPAAQSSHALRPQQDGGAVPGCPGPQLSTHHERIYRFLEANGPCKALHIAQALGMRTAKDVNPDLYAMRNHHLLNFDGQTWTVYGSGQGSVNSGGRQQSAAIIYQQNPINMICQQGANSHISIANSKATQIGHGNVIQSQTAFSEPGLKTPHYHPLPVPGDPSAPDAPLGAWGTQDIYMEKSMLRRVQLGRSNQMNLLRDPGEDLAYSFSCSPPERRASCNEIKAKTNSSSVKSSVSNIWDLQSFWPPKGLGSPPALLPVAHTAWLIGSEQMHSTPVAILAVTSMVSPIRWSHHCN